MAEGLRRGHRGGRQVLLRAHRRPANKAAYKDDWAALDHVEVVDKYNGKIILKEPFAPLWKTTLPIGSGRDRAARSTSKRSASRSSPLAPIGCGPYYLDEWVPKQKITLKRNPDYFGEAPYYDEIHFFPIDDDKTAEVALEAGDIDFGRVDIGSIPRYENNPNVKLIRKPSLRYRWIGMNVENPKLKDINVRQAIRYALDVPAIVKATYLGQAEPEYGAGPARPGRLLEGRAALRRATWRRRRSTWRRPASTSLDLRIDIEDTSEYRSWAEIAQQNLKEVGINLTINPMDSSSFWALGEGDKGKEIELFSNNYSMQPDPSWATMWFTCEQIGVWNWERWCNPKYDDLHNKALITMDDAQRETASTSRCSSSWDEDCKCIFITHGELPYGYLPTIQPVVSPHGIIQPVYFKAA